MRTPLPGHLANATLNTVQAYQPRALFPELVVVKIGGHALFDHGAGCVEQIARTLTEVRDAGQPLLVVTGGGERVRHVMALGRDLALPVAVMHRLGSKISEQNACIMEAVLYAAGGIFIHHEEAHKIWMYCRMGLLPILSGTPSYGWFEATDGTATPPHRTDTGATIIAETLGAQRLVLAKDVDGYIASDGALVPRAPARRLLDAPDSPVEREALRQLQRNHLVREAHLVNCHDAERFKAVLLGKRDGGTVIHAE